MLKLEFAALCESASIDISTNQLSLFKLIESINYTGPYPLFYPKLTFVMLWRKEDDSDEAAEEAEIRIRIEAGSSAPADFQAVPPSEVKVQIPAGRKRARVLTELVSLPIFAPGPYGVTIQKKQGREWQDIDTVYIDVTTSAVPEVGGAVPL